MGGVTSRWKTSSYTDVTSDGEATDEEVTDEEVTGEEVIVEVDETEAIDNAVTCFAWVTLATNDSYSLGALVLAHSLRNVGTAHKLAVLITPAVSQSMREQLSTVFDVVKTVDVFDSKDEAHLALMKRPELGVTFTKLHCWRLTEFDKCVFLDADTLVVKNCDELFEREELSAAPDVGWPDCFNTGVFVYTPSVETFGKLLQFSLENGSFDGGDQGLLNQFFGDWASKDITKHLPFVYNLTSVAMYSYIPAYKQYSSQVRIVHFIGTAKPWLYQLDPQTRTVNPGPGSEHLAPLLQKWWDIFCEKVHQNLATDLKACAEESAVTEEKDRDGDKSSSPESSGNIDSGVITGTAATTQPRTPYIDSDDSRQINLPYHPFDVKSSSGELLNITFLEMREMETSEPDPELLQHPPQEKSKPEELEHREPEHATTTREDEPPAEKAPLEEPKGNDSPPDSPHDEEPVKDVSPFNYETFFPDETCVQNYLEQNVLTYKPLDEHKRHYPAPQQQPPPQSQPKEQKQQETPLPRFLTIPENDRRQSMNVYSPKESQFPPPPEQPQQPLIHQTTAPTKLISQEDLTQGNPPVFPKWKSMSNLESQTSEPKQTVQESFWKSHPSFNVDSNRKFTMPKLKPILPKEKATPEPASGDGKVTHYTEFHMSSDWGDGLPCERLGFVEKRILEYVHKSPDDVAKSRAMSYLFPREPEKKTQTEDGDHRNYDLSTCQRQRGNQPLRNVTNTRSENNCFLPVLKPLRPKKGDIEEKSCLRSSGKTKKVKKPKTKTEQQQQKNPKMDAKPAEATSVEDVLKRLINYSKDYQKYFFTAEKPVAAVNLLKNAHIAGSHESPRLQYSKEFDENAMEEKRGIVSGTEMSPLGRVRSHSFPGERPTKVVSLLDTEEKVPIKTANVFGKEATENLISLQGHQPVGTASANMKPLRWMVEEGQSKSSNTSKTSDVVHKKEKIDGLDVRATQAISKADTSLRMNPVGSAAFKEVEVPCTESLTKIADESLITSKTSAPLHQTMKMFGLEVKVAEVVSEDIDAANEKTGESVSAEAVKDTQMKITDESVERCNGLTDTRRYSDVMNDVEEYLTVKETEMSPEQGNTVPVGEKSDSDSMKTEEATTEDTREKSAAAVATGEGKMSKDPDLASTVPKESPVRASCHIAPDQFVELDSHGINKKTPKIVASVLEKNVEGKGLNSGVDAIITGVEEKMFAKVRNVQEKKGDVVTETMKKTQSVVVETAVRDKSSMLESSDVRRANSESRTDKGTQVSPVKSAGVATSRGMAAVMATNMEPERFGSDAHQHLDLDLERVMDRSGRGTQTSPVKATSSENGKGVAERRLKMKTQGKGETKETQTSSPAAQPKSWKPVVVEEFKPRKVGELPRGKSGMAGPPMENGGGGLTLVTSGQQSERRKTTAGEALKDKARNGKTTGRTRRKWRGESGSANGKPEVNGSRNDAPRKSTGSFGKGARGQARSWQKEMDVSAMRRQNTTATAENPGRPTTTVGRLPSGSFLTLSRHLTLGYIPTELSRTSGIAGAIAKLSLQPGGVHGSVDNGGGAGPGSVEGAHEDYVRRQNWEMGTMDYMGKDSFDNIWSKICQTIDGKASKDLQTPSQVDQISDNASSPQTTPHETHAVDSPEEMTAKDGGGQATPRRKASGPVAEITAKASEALEAFGKLFVSGPVVIKGTDSEEPTSNAPTVEEGLELDEEGKPKKGVINKILELVGVKDKPKSETSNSVFYDTPESVEEPAKTVSQSVFYDVDDLLSGEAPAALDVAQMTGRRKSPSPSLSLHTTPGTEVVPPTPTSTLTTAPTVKDETLLTVDETIKDTPPVTDRTFDQPGSSDLRESVRTEVEGIIDEARKTVEESLAQTNLNQAMEAFGKSFVSGPVAIKSEVPEEAAKRQTKREAPKPPEPPTASHESSAPAPKGAGKVKREAPKPPGLGKSQETGSQNTKEASKISQPLADIKKPAEENLNKAMEAFGKSFVSGPVAIISEVPQVQTETSDKVVPAISEVSNAKEVQKEEGTSKPSEPAEADVNKAMEAFGKSFVSGPITIKSEIPVQTVASEGSKADESQKREDLIKPAETLTQVSEENVNKAMEVFGKSFASGPVAVKSEIPAEASTLEVSEVQERDKKGDTSKQLEHVTQPAEAKLNKAMEVFGKSFVSGPVAIKSEVSDAPGQTPVNVMPIPSEESKTPEKEGELSKAMETVEQQAEENLNKAMETFGKSFVSGPVAIKSEIPDDTTPKPASSVVPGMGKAEESPKMEDKPKKLEGVPQPAEEYLNKAMEAFGKSFVSGPVAIKSDVPETPSQKVTTSTVSEDSKSKEKQKEIELSKPVEPFTQPAEANLNKAMEGFGKSFISGPVAIKSDIPEGTTAKALADVVPDVGKTEEPPNMEEVGDATKAVEKNVNKAMEAFGNFGSFASNPIAMKSEISSETVVPVTDEKEKLSKPLKSITQVVEENINKAMEDFGKAFASGPIAIKSEAPTEASDKLKTTASEDSKAKEPVKELSKPVETVMEPTEANVNKAMEVFGKSFVSGPIAIKSEIPEDKAGKCDKEDSEVPPALPSKEKLGKSTASEQGVAPEQRKLESAKLSEQPKSGEVTQESTKAVKDKPSLGPEKGVLLEPQQPQQSLQGVPLDVPEPLKAEQKTAEAVPHLPEPKASEALEAFGKAFISGPVVLKSEVTEPEPKPAGHSNRDETETDAVHRRLCPEPEEPIYCNIDEVEEIRVSTPEERERVKPNGSKLTEQILKAIPPPRRKPFSDAAAQDLARGILPPVEPSILLDRPLEGEQVVEEPAPGGAASGAPPIPPRRNRSKGRDAPQPPPKKKGGKK